MRIYIAFGSNKGLKSTKSQDVLKNALAALAEQAVTVEAVSRFWHSPAWPDPSDPAYVNAVARVSTALDPLHLLALLHDIEARFGRERRVVNAPRTLDLDIIDYEGRVSAPGEAPILPHPRATRRAFVLLPLRDIAPDWTDPASGEGIDALISRLDAADIEATIPVS
ncbi:2-amino-4-hydroxy-6-hydroxymethyldihydropteridine diphosphokinase [Glycocaulis sp.]|uniref:2-amino-4-hydroxy-6- hydroxymethyldihydropteridine diphosphokinase n=1 Tax=Glycocaulis sp. TaxID=1969725 RepID=UPI0025BE584D|nr:2-amino-4-hydroxy-6-hydroxymethyldihydropteridine diphosphokinase [Glycocaulis sp.]MCH8521130.1 2-amino-4-hydroxy-6-hydroxymethyldihydropteridine diphosphokinase [Glycocaulis sp.]